jgi:hypothetical protein
MSTRTIVTSQPDVACDVCERRLLRGEQPDVFLAGGRRRTVCELCAPRATHEGWLREADRHSVSLPVVRARRGRNLFDRLRQLRDPVDDPAPPTGLQAQEPGADTPYEIGTQASYDFLEPSAVSDGRLPAGEEPSAPLTGGDLKVERALAVFNAGEHPRRVAGVARSLGAPEVSVGPVEDSGGRVTIATRPPESSTGPTLTSGGRVAIVIAWELCWYRYEIDLGEEASGALVVAQGTELGELAESERLVNATADELGALSLTLA